MNRPRYETILIDGDTGEATSIKCENITCLGGAYCSKQSAELYFEAGHNIAICYDGRKDKTFYLVDASL